MVERRKLLQLPPEQLRRTAVPQLDWSLGGNGEAVAPHRWFVFVQASSQAAQPLSPIDRGWNPGRRQPYPTLADSLSQRNWQNLRRAAPAGV